MVHTFIILDGHPTVFTQTARRTNEQLDPTQQLPLVPVWSNMVQGSIEFCRVVWDLADRDRHPINVLVAGATPFLLNTVDQQHTRYLEAQFPQAQPRYTYTHDRLQTTIESALDVYLKHHQGTLLNRCRIVIVAMAKQPTDHSFQFRNNADDKVRDLRWMAHEAIEKINRNNTRKIDHVDIDVLQLLPFIESQANPLPKNRLSKQVSLDLTMSVYHIPNGQDDLKYAMRHLAQLYYHLYLLHISNIPMKSNEQTNITRTVSLFYQANGQHLIDQPKPPTQLYLHEPHYLQHRELQLIYSKRSKRALPENEWCTCMHSISPLNLHDIATEVFLEMTTQGSISYLVHQPSTTEWSHVLMAHGGTVFLHCLNSQLHHQFSQLEHAWALQKTVKTEDNKHPTIHKTSELTDSILRPNLYDHVQQFMASTQTVLLDPFRFSHHLLITHRLNQQATLSTSQAIERATRWRTCFRDCEGTDCFPIQLETTGSIEDLANDALNGIPQSSGFGVAVGLVRDLFDQLQDVFVKEAEEKEMKPTKELISMLVSQLRQGMEGAQKVFIKGLSIAQVKLVSKRLLVALYLIGKRFMHDSDPHQELCQFILLAIHGLSEQMTDPVPRQVKKEGNVVDDVWHQVTQYETMSLREKEEAAQGILLDTNSTTNEPIPFANQLHLLKPNTKFNPTFRSRRGHQPLDPRQETGRPPLYPDPSAAVPYLVYVRPTLEEKAEEEQAEEESLGEAGNLLWLYWMHDKARKRGNQEQGDLSSTELKKENHQWKRVKKEFLGRMAMAGEKGETL